LAVAPSRTQIQSAPQTVFAAPAIISTRPRHPPGAMTAASSAKSRTPKPPPRSDRYCGGGTPLPDGPPESDGLRTVAHRMQTAQFAANVAGHVLVGGLDSVAVKSAAEALKNEPPFSALNIVVNNAGVPVTRSDRQIFWADQDWRDLIEVKTLGALRVVREFLPMMNRDGTGRIINVTGASGVAVWCPALGHGLNNAALIHATGYLAQDLWAERITVNAIIPGLVGTEFRETWAAALAAQQGKSRDRFLADFCRERGI